MLSTYFTLEPSSIHGQYNIYLVGLSYFIASFASYVALDLTKWMRNEKNFKTSFWWVVLGAFAIGSGIWTMHFIGMLAFIMPMPMQYDPFLTVLSWIFAVIASGFAFYL